MHFSANTREYTKWTIKAQKIVWIPLHIVQKSIKNDSGGNSFKDW